MYPWNNGAWRSGQSSVFERSFISCLSALKYLLNFQSKNYAFSGITKLSSMNPGHPVDVWAYPKLDRGRAAPPTAGAPKTPSSLRRPSRLTRPRSSSTKFPGKVHLTFFQCFDRHYHGFQWGVTLGSSVGGVAESYSLNLSFQILTKRCPMRASSLATLECERTRTGFGNLKIDCTRFEIVRKAVANF